MLTHQARLDKELAEVKEEVACKEKQHRGEEAAATKKATEAKAAQERRKQEEAKVWVARYEAHVKMLVPTGEPIVALGSDSDIESGVRLLGVTNLVSEENYLFFFCFLEVDWTSWVPRGGSLSAPPA